MSYFSYWDYPTEDQSEQASLLLEQVDTMDDVSATNALAQNPSLNDFVMLADSIPVLCWMADSRGHIFWLNKRWHDYCGTEQGTDEGLNWEAVHDPQLPPDIRRQYQLAILTGEPFEMVFPLKGQDGVYRDFLTRAVPSKNSAGQIERWFGMNTDVSELHKAQKAAEKAKEQIELALNSGIILGTWVWDIATDRLSADERFAHTFGLDPQRCINGELSLEEATSQIHPDDRDCVLERIQNATKTCGAYTAEYRVLRCDGKYCWIEANGRCEFGKAGALRFPGVLIDISRRKEAEEKTQLANQANQKAYNLLQAAMESVPALIYMKDREGRFLLANSHSLALLGHPWEEVEGRSDADFLLPDQAREIREHDLKVMETRETIEIEEVVGEVNGRPRIWLSRKAPMLDEHGELAGIIGSSMEITERKQAEETRRLLVRELHHRVKNLFAMVSSIIRMTYKRADSTAEASKALIDRINALAAAHDLILPGLANDSMKSETSLETLLRSVLQPHIGNWSRCKIEGPEIILGVQGSTTLALAFSELATNAVKYGSLTVPDGCVNVTWDVDEDRCRIIWKEIGGPSIVPPSKTGFGSELLKNGLKASLGGGISYDWKPAGVEIAIDASLAVLEQ